MSFTIFIDFNTNFTRDLSHVKDDIDFLCSLSKRDDFVIETRMKELKSNDSYSVSYILNEGGILLSKIYNVIEKLNNFLIKFLHKLYIFHKLSNPLPKNDILCVGGDNQNTSVSLYTTFHNHPISYKYLDIFNFAFEITDTKMFSNDKITDGHIKIEGNMSNKKIQTILEFLEELKII